MSQRAAGQPARERELGEHIRERSSGILTFADGKIRRLFCLREGRLIHAASNVIEEQFDEFLVRERYLTAADRARSEMESEREGVAILQWLQDQELIGASELDAAIGAHASGLLLAALNSRTFEIAFQPGTPNLKGKPVTDLATPNILFEFLKEYPKSSYAVRVRLGNLQMHPVRVTNQETEVQDLARTYPLVDEIWKLCDGDLTLAQLATTISDGEDAAMRTLYGLVLIGAVEAITGKARVASRVADVPVTRSELLMRLDGAIDADHYGVLELMSEAGGEQLLSSYYLLARRYHPDRFRSGELSDLLPRIESYFAQVTEAYNTLADPALRERYDEELATAGQRADDEPEYDTSYLARQNYLRGKSLVNSNQFRQAVTFLENAIQLDENVPEYLVAFGSLIARNPLRREEAEEHLRRGLELDPTVLDGHTALADLLVKRDKIENAIQVLTEGLKWFPDHTELTRRLNELAPGRGRGRFGR